MSINIFMPWYLGDYLNSTNHLQAPQHWGYMSLLAAQWVSREQSLPNDLDALVQVTRIRIFFVDAKSITEASLSQVRSISDASTSREQIELRAWVLDILNEFFVRRSNGRWVNLRCYHEHEIWAEKQERLSNRGRAGAKGRWGEGYVPKRRVIPKTVDAQALLLQYPSPSPGSTSTKAKTSTNATSLLAPGRSSAQASPRSTRGSAKAAPPSSKPVPSPLPGPNAKLPARRPTKGAALPTPPPKPAKPTSTARKSVATVVKKQVRPSKTAPIPDLRFGAFKDEIFRYWDRIRGVQIKAGLIDPLIVPALPSWGTRDRVELNALLAANPDMNVKAFMGLLLNRARSQDVIHFDHPYRWIKSLMMFSAGPVDRFNKKLHR
jgi:uncharacterized protein YdaU (DUF1376 family)